MQKVFYTAQTVRLAFWFAVSVYGYISTNAINLFISQFFFAFATTPLFFEAAVEVMYPVPEGSYVIKSDHLFNVTNSLSQSLQDPLLESSIF